MAAHFFTHEERLEMTKKKMAFRESLKYTNDIPAAPGAEEHQEKEIKGNLCPNCNTEGIIHESGCIRCVNCGWSKC